MISRFKILRHASRLTIAYIMTARMIRVTREKVMLASISQDGRGVKIKAQIKMRSIVALSKMRSMKIVPRAALMLSRSLLRDEIRAHQFT